MANSQLVYKAPKEQKIPTNSDFLKLKGKLQNYISKNPDRHIPLLVRFSFHDLFLQERGAMKGCIAKGEFMSNHENAGLEQTFIDLLTIVKTHFPKIGFSFGDVIAFAGKVAAETAYPCIKVPFKFNRSPCDTPKPNETVPAPSGFNSTIQMLKPSLDYLGGSLSAEDIAILLAGAHGIKGARATGASGWRGLFSNFSSGKAFITKTFQSIWTFLYADNEFGVAFQYFTGKKFDNVTNSSIIRLPVDMMFYPSKIQIEYVRDDNPLIWQIEGKLKGFITRPRNDFDQEFAKAYGKMLAIGDADMDYIDDSPTTTCPLRPLLPGRFSSIVEKGKTVNQFLESL